MNAATLRQHLSDCRTKIASFQAMPSPTRAQVDELAEWQAAERETLEALRAVSASTHRLTKRANLGRWISARRARLISKITATSNPGDVCDHSPESLARCRARLAQLT